MANASLALAALADPTRREIFERLARSRARSASLRESCPSAARRFSQHLKALKDAGLVLHRAHGTRNIYEIDPNGLGALRAWLDQFWAEALESFKAEVEKDEPTQPQRQGGAQPSASPPQTPAHNPKPRNKENRK